MSAIVLPFPGNPGAPVVPITPRPHFGLREASFCALSSVEWLAEIARKEREAMRAPKQPPSLEDVLALTDLLDEVARRAQALSLTSGKAAFQLVAQDAESLSERLVHLVAGVE